jgi:hypothetical protein
MQLTFVPLLQTQRDLYALPRSMERFHAYLAAMKDPVSGDLKLPLVAMNPMGKEHVPALLDQWLALGADEIGARAVAGAAPRLAHVPGTFQVGLVITDDAKGRWTNRYLYEFADRFHTEALRKRRWLTGLLWTSEEPSASVARETVLACVYRAAYIAEHGQAVTLGAMLAQEGYAMAGAGSAEPALEADDLAYTRETMARYFEATDQATVLACLFGDEAATSLGYPPLGFSHRAGLALALADALTPPSGQGG